MGGAATVSGSGSARSGCTHPENNPVTQEKVGQPADSNRHDVGQDKVKMYFPDKNAHQDEIADDGKPAVRQIEP